MKDEDMLRYFDEGGDIRFEFSSTTVGEYKRKGYRKLIGNIAEATSEAFRIVPGQIAHRVYDAAVHKSFDEAVQGSLIAVLKPGTYMPASKTTPGALSNIALSTETNQVGAGNPVFYKNNAVLNTPVGPQIALQMLNIASFVVGQANMILVRQSFDKLQGDVREILEFMQDEQKSKLEAAIIIHQRVCCEMKYALGNNGRINDLISQIKLVVFPTALELKRFSESEMERIIARLDQRDNKEKIHKNCEDVGRAFIQYKVATLLCAKSLQILLYLSQTSDLEEINELYLEPLNQLTEEYEDNSEKWFRCVTKYLHSCKELNGGTAVQNILKFGSAAISALYSPLLAVGVYDIVDTVLANKQKTEKTTYQNKLKETFKQMVEFDTIEAPYLSAKNYEKLMREGIVIAKIGDEIYINLPDKEKQ